MWKTLTGQTLTQNDSFVAKATGTAALMTAIYTWTIPRNMAVLLNSADVLSAYLADVGAEMLDTDSWQLQIKNSITAETAITISSGIYVAIKEFQDQNLVKRIGGKYLIESDFILEFQANATTVLVNANCYISIGCTKYIKVSGI